MEALSSNDKTKITEFCDAAVNILQQIADLKEGLADTTKTLAGELDVKPASLTKMANIAFKGNLDDVRDGLTEVEELLAAAGR